MFKMLIKMYVKFLLFVSVFLHDYVTEHISSNTLCRWKSDLIGYIIRLDVKHSLNLFED